MHRDEKSKVIKERMDEIDRVKVVIAGGLVFKVKSRKRKKLQLEAAALEEDFREALERRRLSGNNSGVGGGLGGGVSGGVSVPEDPNHWGNKESDEIGSRSGDERPKEGERVGKDGGHLREANPDDGGR